MTHARSRCLLTEQAVGWALHALEPDEEMALLLHIPQCAECRAAVHDTEVVLARFGAAVEQVIPPPRLRSSILAAAVETPQLRPATHFDPPTVPVLMPVPRRLVLPDPPPLSPPPPSSSPRSTPVPRSESGPRPEPTSTRPPRRRGTTRRRLVAIAAAVVAVISIGGLGVRAAQLQTERDTVAARVQSLDELVQQLNRPHAILSVDNGVAVAAVVLAADQQREVYTVGLPANAADRTYVLWGIKGSTPQALGAFDVASADRGLRNVGTAGQDSYQAYAISIEPGRTAPALPTDVVAKGALVT